MTKIVLDHGDHGHFLTMALNVLVDKASIITDQAIFDFWRNNQTKNSFMFDWEYKHLFVEKDYRSKNFIWIVRDDPVLWAYNLCTRAVLPTQKNFSTYKKGITIDEFESNPWKWAPYCGLTSTSAYAKIKRKSNGSVHKKSFRSWYRQFIFNEHWLMQSVPDTAITFNMTSFYDLNLFISSLKKIEAVLHLNFNWHKAEKLYNGLHDTLSYDKRMAHDNPTILLETYKMSGIN